MIETLREKAVDLEPSVTGELNGLASSAEKQASSWVAFKILREGLGKTTYRETIKEAFLQADTVEIPEIYRQLWSLHIRGVLNLNLDRLATRAHSELKPGVAIAEFSGRDVSRLRSLLNGHHPFIGNLHGVFEDAQSWVFTKGELDDLLNYPPYKSFIEAVLSTHSVFFVGISADDMAVGGHLERLASLEIETPAHFWLTGRTDAATDAWAENAGVRIIRYERDDEHRGMDELFEDLTSFLPEESATAFNPVAPTTVPASSTEGADLPPIEELLQLSAEEIRLALNEKAKELLDPEDANAFAAYAHFSRTYDQAIYRAWYTSTQNDENILLGYTLEKEVAIGSFGRVYAATSPGGEKVAVKVLLGEARTDADMLRSFRRGVRSMRILQERQVQGMVSYLAASEIPALVAMEWINGPNLAEAAQAGYLDSWGLLLGAAVQLARIVRSAHELPERVLHRDLRPSNVMLSGYYENPDQLEVVVLDFDLSWHKGSYEQSVVHSSAVGYLAPEQMRNIPGVSTRNAAVDSFGIGMTLFFLCSRTDPSPNQHRHQDWHQLVKEAVARLPGGKWKSIPERLARLIITATQDKQSMRWDMAEISGELERLEVAAVDPSSVASAELLTEEIAARSEVFVDYAWDEDRVSATKSLWSGMRIELQTELEAQEIHLHIDWASTGSEERHNLGKYIKAAAVATVDQLRASGWGDVQSQIDVRSVVIDGRIEAHEARGRAAEIAGSVDRATRKLKFD